MQFALLWVVLGPTLILGPPTDPGRTPEPIEIRAPDGRSELMAWDLIAQARGGWMTQMEGRGIAIAIDFASIDAGRLLDSKIPWTGARKIERDAVGLLLAELLAPVGLDLLTVQTSKGPAHLVLDPEVARRWAPTHPSAERPSERDRNVAIEWVELDFLRADSAVAALASEGDTNPSCCLLPIGAPGVNVVGIAGPAARVSEIAAGLRRMDHGPARPDPDEIEIYRVVLRSRSEPAWLRSRRQTTLEPRVERRSNRDAGPGRQSDQFYLQ